MLNSPAIASRRPSALIHWAASSACVLGVTNSIRPERSALTMTSVSMMAAVSRDVRYKLPNYKFIIFDPSFYHFCAFNRTQSVATGAVVLMVLFSTFTTVSASMKTNANSSRLAVQPIVRIRWGVTAALAPMDTNLMEFCSSAFKYNSQL